MYDIVSTFVISNLNKIDVCCCPPARRTGWTWSIYICNEDQYQYTECVRCLFNLNSTIVDRAYPIVNNYVICVNSGAQLNIRVGIVDHKWEVSMHIRRKAEWIGVLGEQHVSFIYIYYKSCGSRTREMAIYSIKQVSNQCQEFRWLTFWNLAAF